MVCILHLNHYCRGSVTLGHICAKADPTERFALLRCNMVQFSLSFARKQFWLPAIARGSNTYGDVRVVLGLERLGRPTPSQEATFEACRSWTIQTRSPVVSYIYFGDRAIIIG
jgi:hypothetical protein